MNNYKPIFHITGEKGWINDPNGVIKFKGQYHVFYQHHPYSCVWGPMHWGHVVSDDLLHWTYLPYALVPGDEYDRDGCFSGSAFVVDDTLYIVYTGFKFNGDSEKIRQIQCLASSKDGIHFEKHGAIVTEKELPKQYKPCDFRDPQIIFKDGYYLLFVAGKKKSGGGSILLFKSKDLNQWQFVNDVLPHNSDGEMIECVGYDDDLGIIMYSEQNFPKDNPHCFNNHSTEYELGKLNKDGKFVSSSPKTLIDYGFDFYAPQMMYGEHYLIGWMNMWDRSNPSNKYGFAGMMTVPRKIYVENGKMLQKPVIFGELDQTVSINDTYKGHLSIGTLVLETKDLKDLSINLRIGKDEVTKFYLQNDEFIFDRSHSGEVITGTEEDEFSIKGIRKMPFVKEEKHIIYIVLDKYSVEIFVNGVSMSNLIYPHESSDGFEINVNSKEATLSIYK